MKPTSLPPVGRVVGLWRYPVKSMAGEELVEVDVSWYGLAGDRRWAFVRDEARRSGFPWLTLRQRGDLRNYVPSWADPERPDESDTRVRTPEGILYSITDPALATELYPSGARAMKQDRGVFDAFPLSLITVRTIRDLEEKVSLQLDIRRFRPNLVVETNDDAAFPEDTWVGSTLRIGGVRLRVDKRDGRCVVITIDPDSGRKQAEVLRAVAQERQGCLGVYGSVVAPGRVRCGDPVWIEKP